MKFRFVLLSQIILVASALSACGVPQAPGQFLPRSFQSAANPHRAASGQLTYAHEMRGFSSIQNPMRTMNLEFTTSDGQTMSMHADRFIKYPEFNIAVRVESAPNPNQQAQYFSSKDQAKVRALIDTLQQLDTQTAEAAHKEALARILAHLNSTL